MLDRPPISLTLVLARSSRLGHTKRSFHQAAMSISAVNHANEFVDFLNASPTPFHAVKNGAALLEKAGFKLIKERDSWSSTLKPGGQYYFTRNGSTLAAFAIGKKWKAGNPLAMVGTHTDSPVLRIKPHSKKQADGFLQVGVETYGGGKWMTWFDRDLSIAGRLMVKEGEKTVQKLVKVDRPILRIPTLAIHLDRAEDFTFNKETQLLPIAGLVAAELNRQCAAGNIDATEPTKDEKSADSTTSPPIKPLTERHHPYIVEIAAQEAGCAASDIVDFELILYDTQKSCLGGLNSELIFSPRLDNLMMTYCGIQSIIKSLESASLDNDQTIRVLACFDHEEIGSLTQQGADSNLLPSLIRRLSVIIPSESAASDASYDKMEDNSTAFEQTLISSFLISADVAHSVNPNYGAKYEADHRPEMNKGTVLKINANARYATNSPGIALMQEVANRAQVVELPNAKARSSGVPLQLFVVRNDSPCGGTIGPMLSAKLGVRTLDLGNPILSMHSIRETGGCYDVAHGIALFESFYRNYNELESKIIVD